MAYQYVNQKGQVYYLHGMIAKLRSGRNQPIYFFARIAKSGALDILPPGFKVVESIKTGLPVLKKG